MNAVVVEDVWKRFLLPEERAGRLKDALPRWLGRRPPGREFWALKGVSFTVAPGQALGLIGPNGAGKSTLLKLISAITRPSRGRVAVAGRLSALIEVGAGFHPDLTGRENVFLNGAFMGLRRREIAERFDSIVRFAELEEFLDVPVKRYSSGMYMRLGFAVAAHVEPDVLLVDEVLAVGDMAFQRKCINRIRELRERGRTIVFVSHNMDAVAGLCDRVLLLSQGQVVADGDPTSAIACYRDLVAREAARRGTAYLGEQDRRGSREIEVVRVELLDDRGHPIEAVETGDPVVVRIHYTAHRPVMRPVFGVALHRSDRVYCYGTNTLLDGVDTGEIRGSGTVDFRYRELPLLPDMYYLTVGIFDEGGLLPYDFLEGVLAFSVRSDRQDHGMVYLPHEWRAVGGEVPVRGLHQGEP